MKGRVAKFDPTSGTGAIRAEDGRVYTFQQGDWRGWQLPTGDEEVRFEPRATAATDIFGIRSIARALPGADQASPRIAAGAALAKARPQVFLAIIVLFVSLFVSVVRVPILLEGRAGVSLLGLPGVMTDWIEVGKAMDSVFGGILGQPKKQTSGLEDLFMWVLTHIVWLVPIAAGVLLWNEWKRATRKVPESTRHLQIVSAVICLALLAVLWLIFPLADLRIGAILIGLCGGGFILTARAGK
jgi:hypothetical protein